MAEPPEKKARTEGGETVASPEPAPATAADLPEVEEPKEKETDAGPVAGPAHKTAVTFYTQDTTMNVMKSTVGNMLVPLTDGGLTYLLAGARANVGLTSGRYCFEFKIVETMNHAEDPTSRARAPQPRAQLRVGVATEGSSLFLGETTDSVCFDGDGNFVHNKTKKACSQKYASDVVAVVLNLDDDSENANTISLFKNGQRACEPQPLPEDLKGKALFPAVTFKNVTVVYNFGPHVTAPLPFKCHTLAEAAKSDVEVLPEPKGKGEAIFPVCLPDEGTFDWLDMFLEENPSYAEISDRAILKWAEVSGLTRPAGLNYVCTSNDKPEMGFGMMHMDDHSIRRVLQNVVPLQSRNCVVMEVKSNLLKNERKDLVSKWANSSLKKKAVVMMKTPPAAFKKRSQELALKQKQEEATLKHQAKVAEEKKKRMIEKRAKELEKEKAKMMRRAEKEKAMLAKKVELQKARAEALQAGTQLTEEQKKEQDAQDAQVLEAMMADSGTEDVAEEEPMEVDEEPPTVELTEEELQRSFRKPPIPDLTSYMLNTSFMKFSLPEKDEGFDEVSFAWAKEPVCKTFLKEWIQQLKSTTRIEDIQPGTWFAAKWKEWQKTLVSWHSKANSYKALLTKRAADKQARVAKRAAAAAAAAAKEKEKEAKAKKAAEEAAAGGAEGEKKEEKEEEVKEEEAKEEDLESDPEDEGLEAEDFEGLDVFGVEDPLDVGRSQPLFSAFSFEDWTMMSLRFELHLLCHSFRKDVDDPDRKGIHAEHLAFYYNKYYKKMLNHKFYGVETIDELLELVRDTVFISKKTKVIEALLPEELETSNIFIMLTEEARRDRVRRTDLGDESARLKFSQNAGVASSGMVQPVRPPVAVRPLTPGTATLAPTLSGPRPGFSGSAVTPPGAAGGVYRPPVRPVQAWGGAAQGAGSWRPQQVAWRG